MADGFVAVYVLMAVFFIVSIFVSCYFFHKQQKLQKQMMERGYTFGVVGAGVVAVPPPTERVTTVYQQYPPTQPAPPSYTQEIIVPTQQPNSLATASTSTVVLPQYSIAPNQPKF